MKKIRVIIILTLISISATCQVSLLDRPDLLEKIKSELHYTYSTDFHKARKEIKDLQKIIPGHPVITFMEALVIYWEYFPLTPEHPMSDKFIALLEETTVKGQKILEQDPENLEGLFFDLFPRALFSEYWADNGKPGKVFPYLNSLYRQTLKGMDAQDRFKEFYFTSGLYNYYIEAYPERHPTYKPVKLLFHPGDLELGLEQLNHCAENAVYVKNEARFFLMHIYLNYESNPLKSSEYASGLYREFPRNPLYTGKYAEVLISTNKYAVADIVVNNLLKIPGDFSAMQFHLFKGMLDEKYRKDYESAFTEYNKALQLAVKFGQPGANYNALAWMGLGRYYRIKKDFSAASRYFKMAASACSYEYIINDK